MRLVNIFNIGMSVKKVIDKELDIINSAQSIANKDVLVGVPEETSSRGGKITNAQLAFIHSNGSPIKNIPARPFVQPGIEKNRDLIANECGQAITSALQGNNTQLENHLKKAGMIGQNAARDIFTENNWTPLAPATIEARARRKYKISEFKTAKGKASNQLKLKKYIANGSFNPLVDTGDLRKSVTYVVRDKIND